MKKRKKRGLWSAISAVLGFACALILGALFYGTMVYQLAGEGNAPQTGNTPAVLALDAALEKEETQQVLWGGTMCSVTTRTYVFADDLRVQAISATPANYLERLSGEGFIPQPVTGYTLAEMDAVCEKRGDTLLLAARRGKYVYVLEAKTDEQTLYTLGASARLEARPAQ